MKLRAAVLDDVRKMIGAAAQEKLASMRYTKHLIKAATLYANLVGSSLCRAMEGDPARNKTCFAYFPRWICLQMHMADVVSTGC